MTKDEEAATLMAVGSYLRSLKIDRESQDENLILIDPLEDVDAVVGTLEYCPEDGELRFVPNDGSPPSILVSR